jgi:O-antigen/teichoic acid export membrane protein
VKRSRPAAVPKLFQRFKHFAGLDRAIGFAVLARIWASSAGVITVLLIARFLTPQEQGYYYTFSSLVALQLIFELGFSFVILQLAAHERAQLAISPQGEIQGDAIAHARLASILQQAVRWYSIVAIIMAMVLFTVGFYFFTTHHQTGSSIRWQTAWALTVIASSLTFFMDPVFSFLEGCGEVSQVAGLRLTQAITGSLLGWLALVTHHGLFSPAMVILGQAGAGFQFLLRYRRLLLPLLRHQTGPRPISWSSEIWPFQWRIAVSWASSYLIMQLFNPVLFAYRGPVEAGRMGMSINIANAVGAIALSWMATKAAPFGTLVARRQFADLDQLFSRTLKQSSAILLATIVLVLSGLLLIGKIMPAFPGRILSLFLMALLLLTIFCNHVVNGEAYYLRAHKREPFVYFWIAIAIVSVVVTVVTGKYWGAAGVTIAYFLIGGLLRLLAATYVFFKKRSEWHAPRLRHETLAGTSQ